jgi:hypothetical protein
MAGLEFRVSGGAKLHVAAQKIKAAGDKPRGQQMSKALRATTKPLEAKIRREAADTMPERGGYSAIFTAALRFVTSIRTGASTASLRLKTFADGKGERRDAPRLDKGELRHPVFGRSRRGRRRGERVLNPWATTSVRPGFYTRPSADAGRLAAEQVVKVLDDIIRDLS